MHLFSTLFINYLVDHKIITSEVRNEYLYGFELLLYTITSTSILLLIGILFQNVVETIIIIIVFYSCQTYGGGFHAKTHIACLATMVIGLSVIHMLLFFDCHNTYVSLVLSGVSCFIMYLKPLILHSNKSYLHNIEKKLKHKSRKITVFLFLFYLVIYMLFMLCSPRGFEPITHAYSYALCASTLSRVVGYNMKR